MYYGQKPEGSSFYLQDGKGNEFIAWGPPTGDKLCVGLTGRTENQLVRDILEGRYNHIFAQAEAPGG